MNDDPIRLEKETIEISGGRKLYAYTFEVEEAEADPMVDSPNVPEAQENPSE
jgi:hypothetical protein